MRRIFFCDAFAYLQFSVGVGVYIFTGQIYDKVVNTTI